MQKRIMAINDISCFGKCALTITLPIISAAGIECSVLPSVVLSAHTGYPGGTFFDMSGEFEAITSHLEKLNVKFDAILTGFLSSMEQIDLTIDFINRIKNKDTKIIVDPTMADNGKMYGNLFSAEFAHKMGELCKIADIVMPNITEACFILDKEYKSEPYKKEYIEDLLVGFKNLGAKEVIITGISFTNGSQNKTIGTAVLNKNNDISYHLSEKIEGSYTGTGDIFASVVTGCELNGFNLGDACQIATDFISECIKKTLTCKTENSTGINFETSLPSLMRKLNII